MANVQHSTLTGASLHEPKGIAAASANRVYVADGAASGSWTTVSNDALSSSAKAFQTQLFHIRDQKASGTAGAALTEDTWVDRELTTSVTNGISGASLASNTITLPTGTYILMGWANALAGAANRRFVHKHRIRNTTAGTTALVGGNTGHVHDAVDVNHATGSATAGQVVGVITLGVTSDLKLQTYMSITSTGASNPAPIAGLAATSGEVEIYADILIWKIA